MGQLRDDVRDAVRLARQRPALSWTIVATLALAVGANTALFSVLEPTLLRPLPFPEADRLVRVWEHNYQRGAEHNLVHWSNFFLWETQGGPFDRIVGYSPSGTTSLNEERPERVPSVSTTGGLLDTLGLAPVIGRTLTPADTAPGTERVALIGEAFWERRYDRDPSVLGRRLVVSGRPHTIVGVVPDRARALVDADIWRPYEIQPELREGAGGRGLQVVARLDDDVTLEEAAARMTALAAVQEREQPERNSGWTITVLGLQADLVREVRPALLLLAGAVGLVLLVGSANIANLLLAQAFDREREMSVRVALGASPWRLVRLVLIEGVVLAVAGGLVGLLVAAWIFDLFRVLAPAAVAENGFTMSRPLLAFALGVTLLSAGLFSLTPALRARRMDLRQALHSGNRQGPPTGAATRRGLVIAEIATAAVLLFGSGVLLESFWRLSHVDPGFDTAQVLTFRVDLPSTSYPEAPEQTTFFERLGERVGALPGVTEVGFVSFRPLGIGAGTSYRASDQPDPGPGNSPVADVRVISGGALGALGVPLVSGRLFDSRDNATAPARVVISESAARELWPDADPLGRHLLMSWGEWLDAEVVGVVGDTRLRDLRVPARGTLYWHQPQLPMDFMTGLVRTSADPASLATALRAEVAALDPVLPIGTVTSLEQVGAESIARERFTSTVTGALALSALLLAAIGIYGVMSFVTRQRLWEMGVRLALGARRDQVLRLVLGEGVRLALAGAAVGLVLAALLGRAIGSLLFETSGMRPWAFAAALLVLVAAAVLAAYIPARRASRVDPLIAIRTE